MIPLARELVSAGHEVVVASGPDMTERAVGLGLGALPAGPPLSEAGSEFSRRVGKARFGSDSWKVAPVMFVEILATPMIADLMEALAGSPPDLIVHEPAAYAGPLLARLLGVPSVCHHFSAPAQGPAMAEVNEFLHQAAGPLWDQWGCPRRPSAGLFDYLLLCLWPPSLWQPDPDEFPTARQIRPTWPSDSNDSSWKNSLDAKPTVYVSFGTTFADIGVLRTIVEALGQQSLGGVITVGPDIDPVQLGATPPDVHIARYIPQAAVLPHCDAVVCHGGSGTMLGALAYGLPLLCIPLGADHFYNAQQCESAGVARVMQLETAQPDRVGAELRVLLDGPDYRSRAEVVRAQINAMPSPAEWVQPLERLAVQHEVM